MSYNTNASADWNAQNLYNGVSNMSDFGSVVILSGAISSGYTTNSTDAFILVSGSNPATTFPIYITLQTTGIIAGKVYTIRDIGQKSVYPGGIVLSGVATAGVPNASIDGSISGVSLTSGYIGSVVAGPSLQPSGMRRSFLYDGQGNFWSV